jgi:DNA polymerase delta subunit 1
MIKFGVNTVQEAMKLGKEAALEITKCFKAPIKLEFEKVYCPYILFNRKRYAGLLWTNPNNYEKIDTKGIESVRRDNCLLIRTMIDQSLKTLLVDRDIEKSIQQIKYWISELL